MDKLSCVLVAGVTVLAFAKYSFSIDSNTTTVPFQLYQDYLILIKGSIGPLKDLTFILDTGATSTVISPHLAKRLAVKGKSKKASAYGKKLDVQVVMLRSLSVGSFQFRMIPAVVTDLSSLPYLIREVDGLVGLNALKRTSFCIDYEKKAVTFGSVVHFHFASSFNNEHHMMAPLDVDGQSLRLLIDTGSMDLILFRQRAKGLDGRVPTRVKKTIQHVGAKRRVELVKLLRVRLGNSYWEKRDAWVLEGRIDGYPEDVDGVLGVTALGFSRINVDFQNGLISWEM